MRSRDSSAANKEDSGPRIQSLIGSVWPIFNVADSCLVLGVALVVWLELTGRQRDGTRVVSAPAEPREQDA